VLISKAILITQQFQLELGAGRVGARIASVSCRSLGALTPALQTEVRSERSVPCT